MNTLADFLPEQYYHVYNRTNNGETLFKEDSNRQFFLKRFNHYLRPFCIVHSYALMKNHFHYSLQLKSLNEIVDYVSSIPRNERTSKMNNFIDIIDGEEELILKAFNTLVIGQFQNLFNSYAKSINKKYQRVGSLFQKKFKRSIYNPSIKFLYLQYYIHHNARKHRVVSRFKDYPHHSYFEIMNMDSTYIDVDVVIKIFRSIEIFEKFHNSEHYQDMFGGLDLDGFIS